MTDYAVVAVRDPIVESVHRVSVAVVTTDGRLVAHSGDPDLVTYWRSCAKPFQLLPLVQDGGVERFGLDRQLLALACASHNAEPLHRELGARWLEAIGITEADLSCGGHRSLWPKLAEQMIHDDVKPTPLWSNCSGKHSGLIAFAKLHGWPIAGYNEIASPVQQRVAKGIAEWSGVPTSELVWGVDGCTAAAVALSLRGMAMAYAKFGTTSDPALGLIRDAMMGEPYVVAGTDRLDTQLMQAWPNRVIAKIGAEGVYSAALPELGLGLALKVEDGEMHSLELALMSVLSAVTAKLGKGNEWPLDQIPMNQRTAIKNTRGVPTGRWETRGALTFA